eukprot:m.920570 g.920570  ORF g.920570 m.920570 type:complete len:626 (-) comp66799_c0_seq1:147-2024(-)
MAFRQLLQRLPRAAARVGRQLSTQQSVGSQWSVPTVLAASMTAGATIWVVSGMNQRTATTPAHPPTVTPVVVETVKPAEIAAVNASDIAPVAPVLATLSVPELVQSTPTADAQQPPATATESSHEQPKPVVARELSVEEVKASTPLTIKYVIIGGGTAAYFAAVGVRRKDKAAPILLISRESEAPYARPSLSKELWFRPIAEYSPSAALSYADWAGKERNAVFQSKEQYCTADDLRRGEPCVGLLSNTTVVDLDVANRKLTLDNGQVVHFEKCLIATGGRPRSLPIIEQAPAQARQHITLYRSIDDFRKLDGISRSVQSVAIIGGGFLGSELSIALAARGKALNGIHVTQVIQERGVLAKVLPGYLCDWTTQMVQEQGVEVLTASSITAIDHKDGKVVLDVKKGDQHSQLAVDHVIVAVGLDPNVELAKKANLELDPVKGGILVNAELEARSGIYAAGDVASFYDVVLGRRREEHHDHAVVSGRLAGENMAGERKHYSHQSFFWSDLGPAVGFEAIGLIDSTLETVSVWARNSNLAPSQQPADQTAAQQTPQQSGDGVAASRQATKDFGKGVVFYLRGKQVVGVVTWNLPDKIPIARRIIREAKTHDNFSQLAALFKVNAAKKTA